MEVRSYSWIVQIISTGKHVQVNADRVSVDAAGILAFYNKLTEGGEYMTFALPPGQWGSCSVMSQLSGLQNGYEVLGKR